MEQEPDEIAEDGGGGDTDQDNLNAHGEPTTGLKLAHAGLDYICGILSFAEMKRLRQVCRAYNEVVRRHPRFLNCTARLEHDWVIEARGMSFNRSPKFLSFRFRYFPFTRNSLFKPYWASCGTNVTRIYFKHVKMPCHEMITFLQECPHLTDVTFNLCTFQLVKCGMIPDGRYGHENKQIPKRTCCPHADGLANLDISNQDRIPPRIHTLVFKYQDIVPLCIMDLLFERANGVIENFTYMDASWPSWKRRRYSPSRADMEIKMQRFISDNQNRIVKFCFLRNHRGDEFLQSLHREGVRMHLRELVLGQKSSFHLRDGYRIFLQLIDDCGPELEKLHLRLLHEFHPGQTTETLSRKPNIKELILDTIWLTQEAQGPVDIKALIRGWPNLESLELWDRNRRRRTQVRQSIGSDYFLRLPRKLKKLQFFHFHQPVDDIIRLIGMDLKVTHPKLSTLCIESGKFFTNQMMQVVIRDLAHLETLAVCNSEYLNDSGLTGLPEATVNTIVNCKTSIFYDHEVDPQYITGRSIKEMKKLRSLSFCMSRKISDLSIVLAFKFPEIREINLSWCLNVTDTGIQFLPKNSPSLERIILMKNKKITHYGLNRLVEEYSTLKNIHTSRSCRDRRLGKQINYVEHPRFKRICSFSKWNQKRPCVYGDD